MAASPVKHRLNMMTPSLSHLGWQRLEAPAGRVAAILNQLTPILSIFILCTFGAVHPVFANSQLNGVRFSNAAVGKDSPRRAVAHQDLVRGVGAQGAPGQFHRL